MPDSLYDTDVLVWSEHQADLLRRLAKGERLNETIDWENVIEEVESVGRSELNGCQSLLRQALIHLLKLSLEPDCDAAAHWRGEVDTFLADARRYASPSIRQRIDVAALYAEALSRLRSEARGNRDPRLPGSCPLSLDNLLLEEPDVMALVGMIRVIPQSSEVGDAGQPV
jgi:hypothetical protein